MKKVKLFYFVYIIGLILLVNILTSCSKKQEVLIVSEIKTWDTCWEITIRNEDSSIICKNIIYSTQINMGDTLYILKNGVVGK